MEYGHLKSGEAKTNSGIKQVSFDPESLDLRPVLFKVYSGNLSNKGTVQGVVKGDIVAQVTWGRSGTHYNVYRHGVDDLTPTQQAVIWNDLKKRHSWLDEWLEPQERGETNIPEDIIPVSEYLAVKVKNSRIENAINRFGIPYALHDFPSCSKGDLQLKPEPLNNNLDIYQSFENKTDGQVYYEDWFGSSGIGEPAVKLDHTPEVMSEEYTLPGIPGIKGWQKWRYIIQIATGIHEKNGKTYGRSFRIWENRNLKSAKSNR